jgi:3-oxoacyl-[acyl-carrier protein] reductase
VELNLTGKVALITGSSRGIGRAIAEMLYAEGCRIVLNSRSKKDLELALIDMPGSIYIVGDVTSPDDSKRLISDVIENFGKLDILICNVGSGKSVPPGNETFEEWQHIFAKNLWSVTNCIEASNDALKESKGAIVCISSICGLEVIPGAPVTYSAAKAALNAYVRGIARPLGKNGIRINALAPGNILFDGSVWSQKLSTDNSKIQIMLDKEVSLKRLGTPKEVASLVAYLVSDLSGFATGSVWTLDGGQVHS